jgi:hypothetical protein
LESQILSEYQELFPHNIPAVTDEAEAAGLFTDGSFPKKIQDEQS